MEMKWHKVQLACPDCQQEPLITNISASSDGEVLVQMVCVKCGTALQMRTTGTRLATQALYQDIEEQLAAKNPQQKLLAPPPPPKVEPNPKADDERDFFKQLGIDFDGIDFEP